MRPLPQLTPPMPMDVCGAESQGQIGYMLDQCLANHLRRSGKEVAVCSIVTETLVDEDDPAFAAPSKPIGPFYSAETANDLALERGFCMREDAGRGWRRVVPSPDPKELIQAPIIATMVQAGVLVVCGGGGGVPVVCDDHGMLHGVEAVIDKDLAAERLAMSIGADMLIILTDVPQAYLNYNTKRQVSLGGCRSRR